MRHPRSIRAALATGLALLATGCGTAHLRVRVSVLRHEYLDSNRNTPINVILQEAANARELIGPDGALGAKNTEATIQAARAAAEVLDQANREAGLVATNAPSLADRVAGELTQNLLANRLAFKRAIDAVAEAERLSKANFDPASRLGFYQDAHAMLAAARHDITRSKSRLQAVLEDERNAILLAIDAAEDASELQGLENVVAAVEVAFPRIAASLNPAFTEASTAVGTADLRGDPLLSHAIGAPADAWRPLFNSAEALTAGSNGDIAIVMDDIDKFSVKGLRADSTAATKATFATLGRIMDIAAAMSGVPVPGVLPTGKSSPNSEGETVDAASLPSRDAQLARAAVAQDQMVRLLDAVLVEAASLDDASIPDAVKGRILSRLPK